MYGLVTLPWLSCLDCIDYLEVQYWADRLRCMDWLHYLDYPAWTALTTWKSNTERTYYTVSRIPGKIRARDCGCKTTTSLEWNNFGKCVRSRTCVITWFSGILPAHERKYSDFTGTFMWSFRPPGGNIQTLRVFLSNPSGPLAELLTLRAIFRDPSGPWPELFRIYKRFSGILCFLYRNIQTVHFFEILVTFLGFPEQDIHSI